MSIFEFTYLYSRVRGLKSNLDGIWQIEYSENIAIFDIMTVNFEYMVRRRTPQISNIAINSLNSIFAPLNSNKDGILDIEFSDPIAIFDIRDAIYIRIQGSEYRI